MVQLMAKAITVFIDGKSYFGGYWIKDGQIHFHGYIPEDEDEN